MNAALMILSLAKKAGRVVSGDGPVLDAIKAGKAKLVIVSKDASANTKKRFQDKSAFRSVPVKEFGVKADLGRALGNAERAVVALTEEGFRDLFLEKLNGMVD